MTTEQQEACTLCEEIPAAKFKVTGIKMFPEKSLEAPYMLCNKCCEGLYPFSPYKPGDKKMREDFWQSVWDSLAAKHMPKKKVKKKPVEVEAEEAVN